MQGSFAAPVFLGPGSNNITIKNCRIEGAGAMQTSHTLPRITFDPNDEFNLYFRYGKLTTADTI